MMAIDWAVTEITFTMARFRRYCVDNDACEDAQIWLSEQHCTPEEVYQSCDDGAFLLWLYQRFDLLGIDPYISAAAEDAWNAAEVAAWDISRGADAWDADEAAAAAALKHKLPWPIVAEAIDKRLSIEQE